MTNQLPPATQRSYQSHDDTDTDETSPTSLSRSETGEHVVKTKSSTTLIEDFEAFHSTPSKGTDTLNDCTLACIGSRSKEAELEEYLFHPDNPWNKEWAVYAVPRIPLPGESIFSLHTGEVVSTSPRSQYSPARRAEVAFVRNNGGACNACRKSKRAASHSP